MARISAFVAGTSLLTLSIACGGEPSPGAEADAQPLHVSANPPSSTFEGSTTVTLESSRPAHIFYSVTGGDPMGPDGRLYQNALTLEDSTLVTFMAVSADGVWTAPVTELYSPTKPLIPPDPVPRSLSINPQSYFFSPLAGSNSTQSMLFSLRSVGFETAHVFEVFIASDPNGWGFYEEGVFHVDTESLKNFDLAPGEERDIEVFYEPKQTLRGAALVIVSDDMRHTDGIIFVELWGRIVSW